jgi:hypothetical protein
VFAYRARARLTTAVTGGLSTVPAPAAVAPAGTFEPASRPADVAPPPVSPALARRPIRLDIEPTADCWVSVTVDGKQVLARVIPAGQRESVAIARDATVEIGDAGAFSYTIDGRPGRSLGEKGQVRTLTLTPSTVDQFVR